MALRIAVDKSALEALCRRHGVRKLAFFGSVLRDDFRADSDVDVLVEFVPGQMVGFRFVHIQDELSDLVGRHVDLNTAKSLSKYFRDDVLRHAEVWVDAA